MIVSELPYPLLAVGMSECVAVVPVYVTYYLIGTVYTIYANTVYHYGLVLLWL
jgi:hypothetical protein